MIQVLKKAAYRHGYLFITAAWLYTISFLFTNYFSTVSSPEKISQALSNYVSEKEKTVKNIFDDTVVINAIIKDNASVYKKSLNDYDVGIFTYVLNDIGNPLLLYWNTNSMSINPSDLQRPEKKFTVHNQNGYFELVKKNISSNGKQYIIASLIPIKWEYTRESKYLKSGFAGFSGISSHYYITDNTTGIPVENSEGIILYRVNSNEQIIKNQPTALSTFLRVIALILLALFINAIARELALYKGFFRGFLFLVTIIFTLRLLSYFFAFLFNFHNYELFDPLSFIYSSSSIHPSLGDLLVNTILFYWVISFVKFNYPKTSIGKINVPIILRYIILFILMTALVVVFFLFSNLISGLITDSKRISFNVIDFFGLNVYTLISFIIICFLVLSFFYLSHILALLIRQTKINRYWRIAILTASGLLLLSINFGSGNANLDLILIGWLIIFMQLIDYRKQDSETPLINSSFFLIWSIFLISSVTALVIHQNKNFEFLQRKTIAEKINEMPNEGGGAIINVTNFSKKFIENNFYRFENGYANKFVKDSIINENFSGYLNKYDVRIYTFDSLNQPLFNDDPANYFEIKGIIFSQGKRTSVDSLYYYENNSDRYSYIYENQVNEKNGSLIGSLFVIVKPKVYKSDVLIPELFRQENDMAGDLTNYSYAVYNKEHVIQNFGSYGFSDSLLHKKIPEFGVLSLDKDGFSELWYNAGNGKVVVIIKQDDWLIESLTLFAYLFCLFIGLCALFHFGSILISTRFRKQQVRKLFSFNIRSQIQATIIGITLFSFVVIGIATISFFISDFRKANKDNLANNAKIMVNEIEERVHSQLVFDETLNLGDFELTSGLERSIAQIAGVHNIDVNFYDLGGNLEVTTQHDIYGNQILSNKMHPSAFYALHQNYKIEYIQEEEIGGFKYLSIYVPVRDENGVPLAFLNVPYLNSQNELNQEISNFLITLIDLNALIFILSAAIAVMFTSRITSSFTLIGNRMKQVSLGKTNEEIIWKSNDELGVLVDEYNKMVQKLEQSAQALARSEREGAWREMAKQVAHEIKNPLTPMKLSIQYLQKAIHNNAPNVKELSQKVAKTLIEQIEQLSKIAGDFSQFANIANVNIEYFDISEVLASVIYLYSADNRVKIEWTKEAGTYMIKADKIQINRLFTNLIKNSIEASPDETEIHIILNQRKVENSVKIAITDKGMGIPESMQQKIFIPNFTTKSSGTGLGLAICKGIIENANGHISFITEDGFGSTFYIVIPLAT